MSILDFSKPFPLKKQKRNIKRTRESKKLGTNGS